MASYLHLLPPDLLARVGSAYLAAKPSNSLNHYPDCVAFFSKHAHSPGRCVPYSEASCTFCRHEYKTRRVQPGSYHAPWELN
jgi:hypothetical protein